jgi:hypothetical protein
MLKKIRTIKFNDTDFQLTNPILIIMRLTNRLHPN